MTYQSVRVSQADQIATVTLDRPPVNAFDRQMYQEVASVFEALATDPDVRVILLTGAGDRAFCAGNDIREFVAQDPAEIDEHLAIATRCFETLHACPVPVVGAINGHALGTGCVVAGAADVLVAVPGATFGLPEIGVGAFGGGGALRRLVPEHKARWLVLSGTRITAEELHRLGSVERLAPAGELLAVARELANRLASQPPLSLRFGKQALNEGEYLPFAAAWSREQHAARQIRRTADSAEAARAFFEKRPPRYQGR